jgi:hypothetical protein
MHLHANSYRPRAAPESGLSFEPPSPDQLTMNGEMEGHKARLQRKLLNLDKFLFVSRDPPFRSGSPI